MAQRSKWTSKSFNPLELFLDFDNPRIDATPNMTQDEIRLLLIETENIFQLISSLIETNGLLAGERIIVYEEDDTAKVLEGNRRTCACQLILDQNLIPKNYKKNVPSGITDELKERVKIIQADIAPNRQDAEITITKRHTEPGIKAWTPIAKQRRIARLLDSGKTIDELMTEFGMSKNNIVKTLREHRLFQFAKDLPKLKTWEIKILNDPKIKPNAFTRFFTLKGVKEKLQFDFDEKQNIVVEYPDKIFEKAVYCIAHELLIPDQATGKTSLNTRATPEEVFKIICEKDDDLKKYFSKSLSFPNKLSSNNESENTNVENAEDQSDFKGSSATQAGAPSASTENQIPIAKAIQTKFFENLNCPIKDDHLIRITSEISKINYHYYPLAATFLIRALIERTLTWCIENYDLKKDLMKEFHSKNGAGNRNEPGLEFILNYCISNSHKMFSVNRVKDALSNFKNVKDIADLVIHCSWVVANPSTVEHATKYVRPLIEKIFRKDVLI
jgi:hypothetical protein